MDLTHPLGVPASQVIVDRDHVNAAARERVEIAGQRGNEGLALAGFHLGDLAVVQDHSAEQLHVEVAHAEHAFAGFADHCKGLGQQLIQQLSLAIEGGLAAEAALQAVVLEAAELLAEFRRQTAQLIVREGCDLLLEQIDVGNNRLVALQLAGIGVTQQQLEHGESRFELRAAY